MRVDHYQKGLCGRLIGYYRLQLYNKTKNLAIEHKIKATITSELLLSSKFSLNILKSLLKSFPNTRKEP